MSYKEYMDNFREQALEVKGEIVVAVDEFLFALRQLDFLGCIEVRSREIEVLAADRVKFLVVVG